MKIRAVSAVTMAVILALAAGESARADVLSVPDPAGDAYVVTPTAIAMGDFGIDLVSVTVDHHDDVLSVSGTFASTVSNSWNNFEVFLDVNADAAPDYVLVWSKQYGFAKAATSDASHGLGTPLCDLTTAETLGALGVVTVSVPRSCIGSPQTVRAHVDVLWFGNSTVGTSLAFVDSAPGTIGDASMQFSPDVAVSSTVVVPSVVTPTPVVVPPVAAPVVAPPVAPVAPVAPAVPAVVAPAETSTVLVFAKRSQVFTKHSTRVVAAVNSAGHPAGKVIFFDGKKKLKSVVVHGGKAVLTLPKSLKVGLHKIHAQFVPSDGATFAPSTSGKSAFRVKK